MFFSLISKGSPQNLCLLITNLPRWDFIVCLALNCLYHTTTLYYVSLNLINPIPVIVPPFFQSPPLFTFLFRFKVSWLLLRNNYNGKCKGCLHVEMIFQGHISTYTNVSIFTVIKMNLREREGGKAR